MLDPTFVYLAVAFGAMRIDDDGASFACHFFEILLRGQSAPTGKNWRANCLLRGGDDYQHGRQN
jgi:hypothetical protein